MQSKATAPRRSFTQNIVDEFIFEQRDVYFIENSCEGASCLGVASLEHAQDHDSHLHVLEDLFVQRVALHRHLVHAALQELELRQLHAQLGVGFQQLQKTKRRKPRMQGIINTEIERFHFFRIFSTQT